MISSGSVVQVATIFTQRRSLQNAPINGLISILQKLPIPSVTAIETHRVDGVTLGF